MTCERLSWMLLILYLAFIACPSEAYNFIVGGKDGWTLHPSENYNQWAGRMRFQVNDTLLFKYGKGSDSVLVVKKMEYDTCNISQPILKQEDGNSVFKLDRSGPFFFISGNKSNCDQAQKLSIVVLSIRNNNNKNNNNNNSNNPPSLSPTPSPSSMISPAPTTTPTTDNSSPPATTPLFMMPLVFGATVATFIATSHH